jgi:hypothetical protein
MLRDSPNSVQKNMELADGLLQISVNQACMPLEALCDFALRNNPNRKLLVVSKVTGRHIPVRPSVAWQAFKLLAQQVASDLPGPIVFIGLAESAIGLGHGVWQAYKDESCRDDTMFIHSSRHKLNSPVSVYFEEEHSHATQEYIYQPVSKRLQQMYAGARSVVIVDDEVTTGQTIKNLANSLVKAMPFLERIVVANLTDWRSEEFSDCFNVGIPIKVDVVSLLTGQLHFSGGPQVKKMPALIGNNQSKDQIVSNVHGRRGLQGLSLDSDCIERARLMASGRTLVLATEEFAFAPLQLATILEELGCDVVYQSTTRSPIIIGHGAIKGALQFKDNYGDGIANFAYNVAAHMYDSVIICHETPHGSIDSGLVQTLNATTLKLT